MKRYGSIYVITNKITNKKYVGQTIQNVEKRFKQHCSDKRSGRHMHLSISYHGEQNFEIEEVMICFDQESLNKYETMFIEILNTFTPNGYNLCKGGANKGTISEETRIKMSDAKKGKSFKRTKTWSEMSRLNKSRAQGGKPLAAKNILTGDIKIYDYFRLALNDGFYEKEIYNVLNGKAKQHKGHIFYYANQSGSTSSNIEEHAQRLEIEPAKAE
jgi:group I intron endonuclease